MSIFTKLKSTKFLNNEEQAVYNKSSIRYNNEFTREINCSNFTGFNKRITESLNDAMNYNYNFIINDNKENKKSLGYITSKSNILKEVNNELIQNQIIKPLNDDQTFFISAMLDSSIKVCFLDSYSGTGKSLISLSTALFMVRNRLYNRIIFLKDPTKTKKSNETYLKDILLHDCNLRMNLDGEISSSNNILDDLHIEVPKIKDFIDGMRNITNTILIIDNVQKLKISEIKSIFSRLNDKCKVVLMGINEYNEDIDDSNAFTTFLKIINSPLHFNLINLWAGKLKEYTRGGVSKFAKDYIHDRTAKI